MRLQMPLMKQARLAAQLLLVAVVALAGGMSHGGGRRPDPAARRVRTGERRPD